MRFREIITEHFDPKQAIDLELSKREVTAVKDGRTAGKVQTDMKVNELFGAQDAVNNSVRWSEPNDEYVVADFSVGNMKYRFHASTDSDEAPGVWEIEFESLGGPTRFGINQTGRSAEVFTVVVNIIKEFISKKNSKIKRLTFAAKEGSRQDLYLRMVRRLVPDWKFEFDSDDGGFVLTKPRPKRGTTAASKVGNVTGVKDGGTASYQKS